MRMHYDREGKPIEWEQYLKLHEDRNYAVVALTRVGELFDVSTVWLGLDVSFGMAGMPLIFETMIFPIEPSGRYLARYSTEEAAKVGHEAAVRHAQNLWDKNRATFAAYATELDNERQP